MFSNYVIEAHDRQAGLVVKERGGFRFYAAHPRYAGLEGRIFASALDATRAAETLKVRPRSAASSRDATDQVPGHLPGLAPGLAQEGRVAVSLLL